MTAWGPAGLFGLALLDSAGIPLPAAVDALLVATAVVNPAAAYLAALLAVVGSAAGSMVLFYIARRGGQEYLTRATQTVKAARFRRWFQTYGLISVFVPALLPIPMPLKVFVLSAGAMGASPRTFLGTMLAARVPRYFGLAWLGSQLGNETLGWLKLHVPHLVAFAVLLALALGLVARRLERQEA